jgi:hypothetical protein
MSDNDDKLEQWNNAFLDNPAKAMSHWTAENNKALRAEYERVQKQDNFWQQLYGRHPHLKEDDHLVRTVLQSKFDVLAGMPVADAIEELAHHATIEVEKQAKRRSYQSEYTVFRGGPDGSSGMPAFQDPEERSLGAAIKARKERRRNAQAGYSFSSDRSGRAVSE